MSVKPEIELVNVPMPDPSEVEFTDGRVGVVDVLHTTPRAVTGSPPSLVILPPEEAADIVIEEAEVVVKVG